MNEREKIIRLWFDMWIKKADLGIDNIFTDDVVYTESWSPKYENRKTVKHWLMKVAGVLLGIGIFLLALFGVLSKKMNYKK